MLLERFPAAVTVTKQTTNDNITTKTNLFTNKAFLEKHVAKIGVFLQTVFLICFIYFTFYIKILYKIEIQYFLVVISTF